MKVIERSSNFPISLIFIKWLTLLFTVADWDSMSHVATKTRG